jgi:WD40 repeat protein
MMNTRHLERVRRRLRDPALAPDDRRAAAVALARDASPAAVRALIDAVLAGDDPQAREHALFALRRAADWRCVGAVCAAWATTRDEHLAALVAERAWVAAAPPTLRVLSALHAGRTELLAEGRASVVLPLVQACEDRDGTLASRARATLVRLARPEAREALCRLAIERDLPAAREAAVVGGYAPRQPRERALFLFLTAQWEAYHHADPDGALLGAAYAGAPAPLRARIATQARRARFTAWARTALAARRTLRPAEMTDGEWEAAGARLAGDGRHEDLWALAQLAPPLHAVRLLRTLAAARWTPEDQAQRARYAELARLAAVCETPPCGPRLRASIDAHRRTVTGLAFDPAGRTLASGGVDGAVRLWSVPGGDLHAELLRHSWTIAGIGFSRDGALLVSASPVGALQVWRVAEAGQDAPPVVTLDGRYPALFVPAHRLAYDRGSTSWVSTTDDRPPTTPPSSVVGRRWSHPGHRGRKADTRPAQALLVSASADGGVQLWQLPEGEPAAELRGHPGRVGRLAVSADGRLLASTGLGGVALVHGRRARVADRTVRLWRLPEGSPAGVLETGATPAEQLAFSPDGRLLAAAGATLCLWSALDGMLLAEVAARAPFAFSPDGRLLAAAGYDGQVGLWRVGGGLSPAPLDPGEGSRERGVTCLAISPDGRTLAVGGADGRVRLWLLPGGRSLGALEGFGREVTSLAFGPCGRLLAAGSAEGEIRLWTTGATALLHVAAGSLSAADAALARHALSDPETPREHRPWLELALALVQRPQVRRRRGGAPLPIMMGEWEIAIEQGRVG